MIAQYPNVFTNGLTTAFGGTSAYITLGLAFSAGRGRGAVLGHNGTNHSSADTNVAGFVYSSTTGYNFTGNYFEMFTNKPKKQVTSPSGTTHLSDDGFVGKNLFFVGSNQDNDGMSEIGAFDTGVGQRAASGGVFSAGNATLSTARTRNAGLGVSRIASMTVAGQNASGTYQTSTEEYNGSAVTAGGAISVAKNQPGACGSLTAGLVQGGYLGSDGSKTSEHYNGTSFSNGGTASSVGGDGSRVAGTQSDALATGGYFSSYRDDAESYNGSSWSTEADTPVATCYHAMAGTGHNAGYVFLGTNNGGSETNHTFLYNGSAWSTLNTAPNVLNSFLGGGTGLDFLVIRRGANASMIWDGTSWAAGATNGVSSLDFYSGSSDTDCAGTSAWVGFGGGTSSSASSAQNTITHHDR